MEVKKENVVNAYMAGDDSVKNALRAMFPDIDFEAEKQAEKRPVTERVKTFEDACRELGSDNPFVVAYDTIHADTWVEEEVYQAQDLIAYLKLRIVCAALNEGWEPKFDEDEQRWYPWHYLWKAEELADKDEDWKRSHSLIDTGDYQLEGYAGFTSSAHSLAATSPVCSRLCLKSRALSDYCGSQFIRLWADFKLCRR